MSLREAAQQALEALKMIDNAMPFPVAKHAIKQLSDALAEPEQWHCDDCGGTDPECPNKPQRTEPEQEPVAWQWKDGTLTNDPDRADGTWTPLYTHPSQRKPLTDEKVWDIYYEMIQDDRLSFARAIERAHGIGGEA